MNFECWSTGAWIAGSWVEESWCPGTPPVPPTPTPIITIEARRWPGPSYVLYQETDVIPWWQRKRENEEIIIL